jgi:membrane protease YdiL (CAAX protease family)
MITPDQSLPAERRAVIVEIALVFLVAFLVIAIGWQAVGPDPLGRQAVVWVANVLMLLTIWVGLRVRGQGWRDLGLGRPAGGWRRRVRTLLQSLAVSFVAAAAFILGSIIMTPLAGTAGAEMGGYDYLRGNLPMLLLALAGVYVVSSFGEEVLYRGFLITRLEELAGGGKGATAAAVAISAVVFGLVHFDWGLVGIVQTTLMGLALAVAFLMVKRNLWVLVLAHAYMDTLLLVQLYLEPAT